MSVQVTVSSAVVQATVSGTSLSVNISGTNNVNASLANSGPQGSQGAAGQPVSVQLVLSSGAFNTNAALGNYFHATLVSDQQNMNNPTNPTDGQVIFYELLQPSSGGQGIPNWRAPSGAFDFGSSGNPGVSASNNLYDIFQFVYSARRGKWLFVQAQLGF